MSEATRAAKALNCGIGDFLIDEWQREWEVKGVNTLNGDLWLESDKGCKTVTMKTAHLWEKYDGEAVGKGGL